MQSQLCYLQKAGTKAKEGSRPRAEWFSAKTAGNRGMGNTVRGLFRNFRFRSNADRQVQRLEVATEAINECGNVWDVFFESPNGWRLSPRRMRDVRGDSVRHFVRWACLAAERPGRVWRIDLACPRAETPCFASSEEHRLHHPRLRAFWASTTGQFVAVIGTAQSSAILSVVALLISCRFVRR
jgi:hypothetical protein